VPNYRALALIHSSQASIARAYVFRIFVGGFAPKSIPSKESRAGMVASTMTGTLLVRTSDLQVLESSKAMNNFWMLAEEGRRQVQTPFKNPTPCGPAAMPCLDPGLKLKRSRPKCCNKRGGVGVVVHRVAGSESLVHATAETWSDRVCGTSFTGMTMARSRRFRKCA
jgi:hypothetical protein